MNNTLLKSRTHQIEDATLNFTQQVELWPRQDNELIYFVMIYDSYVNRLHTP